MRTILLLCFAATCFAQSNLTEPRSGAEPYRSGGGGGSWDTLNIHSAPVFVAAHREPVVRYLVEYTTTEPCYECGTRLAIGCLPMTLDCGIPTKEVVHFEEFESKEGALGFLNADMEHRIVIAASTTGSGLVWPESGLSFGQTRRSFPKTFVRLLEIRDIPVDVKSTKVDIPQPPVSQETKHYAVKP